MRPPTPARPSRNGKMSTGWPRPIGLSPITGGEKGTDTVCQSDSACDVLVNKPVRQTIQFSSPADKPRAGDRSEEHTSELQSRLHLVCRLLLEKKKTRKSSEHAR